ncbi:MAG: ATP-binding protein [Sutterella parvirubra]|nr:ATP-binding protein [Sutterella parvirubra]
MGERGERLTGLLFAMPEADFRGLVAELQTFLPEVVGLETRFAGNDTYRLVVRMRVGDRTMDVSAAHCPDGLLRVLALLAEMRCADGLLCLDEIENVLCMDVLDKLMRSLPEMRRQILFTTQSVIALNYVAREDVRILYRDRLGGTRSGLLADLKENRKYIDFYEEPGDALYFTSLVKASAELRDGLKTGDDVTV